MSGSQSNPERSLPPVASSGSLAAMLRGLLLALLLMEGVAWAEDPLAQARKAVAESDYVSARSELAAALEAGDRSPEEIAEIHRLSGIVYAALGDAKVATEAFTRLLALSPKAELPPGTHEPPWNGPLLGPGSPDGGK